MTLYQYSIINTGLALLGYKVRKSTLHADLLIGQRDFPIIKTYMMSALAINLNKGSGQLGTYYLEEY